MPPETGRGRGRAADPSGQGMPIVRSVERAIRIMRVLLRSPQGKRVAELSEELGLPKRTVRRLLHTLVSDGVVERGEESDLYRRNPMIWLTAACHIPAFESTSDTIHGALRDLEREAGLRVSLSIPSPGQRTMTRIAWYMPLAALGTKPRSRVCMPTHATAAGLVYLASLPRTALQEWLQGELPRFTEDTIVSRKRLKEELARVREQGYAVCRRAFMPDVAAVAVPVRDAEEKTVAAISVGAPADVLTGAKVRRCLPLMRRASKRLSLLVHAAPAGASGGQDREARGSVRTRSGRDMAAAGSRSRAGTAEESEQKTPIVRSVERASRIVKLLLHRPEGRRLSDLSSQLGLHKTTALRLLRTLMAAKVIQKDSESGSYRWNPAYLWGGSYELEDIVPAADAVQRILRDVSEATGMGALLVIPDPRGGIRLTRASVIPRSWVPVGGRERRFEPMRTAGSEKIHPVSVSVIELWELMLSMTKPAPGVRFIAEEGRIEPRHGIASGKIFLASLSPTELREWMRKELPEFSDDAIGSRERLTEELARVREQGYAVGGQEALPGVCAVAVPVEDATGRTVASLVAIGLQEWASDAEIARWVGILRSASAQIAELLSGGVLSAAESARWGV